MNYYGILGVTQNASYEEIDNSYRILAKKYYLENNKSPNAQAVFFNVYDAYMILTDKETRKTYDENFQDYYERINKEIEKGKQKIRDFSEIKCRKFTKRNLWKISTVVMIIILTGSFFLFSSFMEFTNIDKKYNKDIGYMIIPNIPDINNYDAFFIGENHMSAQNFEIEFNLMKYYYSCGIRDFLFECGFADALFKQYYLDSGDEECFQYLFRNSGGRLSPRNSGSVDFFRKIYQWNSTLPEKIRIHGFDIEHDFFDTGSAALWFFVLRKYKDIEGIPFINNAPGLYFEFINDFKENRQRYSSIDSEDMKLFERIIKGMNQGEIYNSTTWSKPSIAVNKERAAFREISMIENLREIIDETAGKKIFAIMGYYHSSLSGNTRYLLSDKQFPSIVTSQPSLANVLKNEIKIASIVLRSSKNKYRWPYFIRIQGWKLAKPYESKYAGNWPYE